MRSRLLRVSCGVVALMGIGAAAVFLFYSEQQLAERRAFLRAFDLRVREVTEALSDLRTAQQAYVAAGQSVGFWMPKVDATLETIAKALTSLQESAMSGASTSALDDAAATIAEFSQIDKRVRGYISSGAQLMAADIVFTEGGESAANAARQVERARLEARQTVDALEAARRKLEALALAGAAVLAILVIAALTSRGRLGGPGSLEGLESLERTSGAGADETAPHGNYPATSIASDLMLQQPERGEAAAGSIARPRPSDRSRLGSSALMSAAQLCTDLGRVNDLEELAALLERAAEVLDASGLVLWLGTASGAELRPALAHGYSPEMLARMPALARSANNAAAAAYRAGALQIVLSRPGSSKGAIVAPVLSIDGCIGVLSAEIRDGGEASDSVQALAAIIAAQLASMMSSAPVSREQRASGAM